MKRLFFLSLILSGCLVGPNYIPPEPVMPVEYAEMGSGETFEIQDEDFLGWWRSWGDPHLDQLLQEAYCYNYDWRIALERVYQARASWWIQVTGLLPEFDLTTSATRTRVSQSFPNTRVLGLPPIQDFFLFNFDAVWELDLFGKTRRSIEAAVDNLEASEEDARGALLITLSEVARIYADITASQAQIALLGSTIEERGEQLDLAMSRFSAGIANEQEVQSTLADLEAEKALLASTTIVLKQSIYSLSTLVGRPPESLSSEFEMARPIPAVFGRIPPAGLPSELLRRRPDIRAAERRLAAATAEIGVAVADLFPTFSLTGSSSSFSANPLQGANYGWASSALSKLFDSASRIWGIGLLSNWTFFDFGKRRAQIRVQRFLQCGAFLAYEKTVMGALQEVEDALAAYFNEEIRQQDLGRATEAYGRNAILLKDLFQAGLASYSDFLAAQDLYLTSQTQLVDSQRLLAEDLIAVYKALGGDWICYSMR